MNQDRDSDQSIALRAYAILFGGELVVPVLWEAMNVSAPLVLAILLGAVPAAIYLLKKL